MLGNSWMVVLLLGTAGTASAIACNDSSGSSEPATPPASITSEEAEKGVSLPFYGRADEEFEIADTYYVARNEPGASNQNNGRFPTHRGGQDGPFENLNDSRIRGLLTGERGVRIVVREGLYPLERLDGFDSGVVLDGKGDERHPVILTGYPGETAVLDGGEVLDHDHLLRIRKGEHYEIKIKQTVTLKGRYDVIENLTIRNGFHYDVLVLGQYSIIRGNKIEGAYEDSVKTTPGSDYGLIADNDISGFASQGIDSVGSDHWLVKGNDIHHPQFDPVTDKIKANAIGGKGGLDNYVIIGNTIHDFDTNRRVGAIAFGGGGNLSLYKKDGLLSLRHAATRMMAFGNTIRDYKGPAVYFQSCAECVFAGNTISGTLGLASLGLPPGESASKTNRGLPLTRNAVVRDNRFAGNHAGLDLCREGGSLPVGTTCYAIFVQNREALKGFVSEGNLYFSDTPPRFAVRSDNVEMMTEAEFRERLGVDRTSSVRPLGDFEH
jgi:Right handed beta helix region